MDFKALLKDRDRGGRTYERRGPVAIKTERLDDSYEIDPMHRERV